jgi:acyl carrier protein
MEDDVLNRTMVQVAEVKRIPQEKVHADSTFEELGMDSLDAMNLLFALEEEFNVSIPDSEAHAIRTVRGAAEGVAKLLAAKGDPALERKASSQ